MQKSDKIWAFVLMAALLAWFMFSAGSDKGETAPGAPGGTDTAAVSPGPDQSASADSTAVRPVSTDSGTAAALPTGSSSDSEVAGAPTTQPPAPSAPALDESGLLPDYRGLSPAAPVTINNAPISTWVVDVERGGIASVTLLQYEADVIEDGHLVLGHPDFPMLTISNGKLEFSHGRVIYNAGDPAFADQPAPAGEPALQIGHQILGTQVEVIQSWKLEDGERYELEYHVTFVNHGDDSAQFDDLKINAGTMRPTDAPRGIMGSAGIDQRIDVLPMEKDDPKMLQLGKLQKWNEKGKNPYADSEVQWAAVQNKYFTVLVDGMQPFRGMVWDLYPYDDPRDPEDDADQVLTGRLILPTVSVPPRGQHVLDHTIYIGPKKWVLLKDETHNKKKIMNFDLFWFWHFGPMEMISRGLFGLISWLEVHVNNYGWAIVLTTILLSILFAYPRHLSSLLSRRMAKLQPEMAKLKEKYGSDPQKLNMKMMELYKIHKVNPAAGCLPVIFQIPVFFALFNVLRSAVELRQASFLWVADLSMPDTLFTIFGLPINPLALAMGASMILHQRLMPTSADSSQQRIMTIMSLGFVVIGYTMPSGLTLYWTTNSICSLIQYQISRRLLDREVDADEAKIAAESKS